MRNVKQNFRGLFWSPGEERGEEEEGRNREDEKCASLTWGEIDAPACIFRLSLNFAHITVSGLISRKLRSPKNYSLKFKTFSLSDPGLELTWSGRLWRSCNVFCFYKRFFSRATIDYSFMFKTLSFSWPWLGTGMVYKTIAELQDFRFYKDFIFFVFIYILVKERQLSSNRITFLKITKQKTAVDLDLQKW